jgi:hypothetical protein
MFCTCGFTLIELVRKGLEGTTMPCGCRHSTSTCTGCIEHRKEVIACQRVTKKLLKASLDGSPMP